MRIESINWNEKTKQYNATVRLDSGKIFKVYHPELPMSRDDLIEFMNQVLNDVHRFYFE